MRTRCPECDYIFRITSSQLRQDRGEVHCNHCGAFFNGLDELLDDSGRDEWEEAPESNAIDEEDLHANFAGRLFWALACLALLILLAAQAGYFEKNRVLKDQSLRSWLEVAASISRQELPAFADTRYIKINNRSLQPVHNGVDSYDFSVSLTNTASIPQVFPSIKLVLTELNGNPVASRVFTPKDYLGNSRFALQMMPVGKPQEIHLRLAKPAREVGGFAFELL